MKEPSRILSDPKFYIYGEGGHIRGPFSSLRACVEATQRCKEGSLDCARTLFAMFQDRGAG